jgi:hypothetical protein
MNSFLFWCALAYLFINSFSSIAQPGAIHSDPLNPTRITGGSASEGHAIFLSYKSPYGIKSLKDFSLGYYMPVPGGNAMAGFNAAGISGYLCYRGEMGYSLSLGESLHVGLGLLADFYPGNGLQQSGIIPGSSFYIDYSQPGRFQMFIYFDSWTGLWTSREYPLSEARFSYSSRFYPRDDLALIAGFSYARARKPVYSIGISLSGGESHEIMVGLRSSPAGFWIAYCHSHGRLEFIVSISSSPVFGYEPGSSFKYQFK